MGSLQWKKNQPYEKSHALLMIAPLQLSLHHIVKHNRAELEGLYSRKYERTVSQVNFLRLDSVFEHITLG